MSLSIEFRKLNVAMEDVAIEERETILNGGTFLGEYSTLGGHYTQSEGKPVTTNKLAKYFGLYTENGRTRDVSVKKECIEKLHEETLNAIKDCESSPMALKLITRGIFKEMRVDALYELNSWLEKVLECVDKDDYVWVYTY